MTTAFRLKMILCLILSYFLVPSSAQSDQRPANASNGAVGTGGGDPEANEVFDYASLTAAWMIKNPLPGVSFDGAKMANDVTGVREAYTYGSRYLYFENVDRVNCDGYSLPGCTEVNERNEIITRMALGYWDSIKGDRFKKCHISSVEFFRRQIVKESQTNPEFRKAYFQDIYGQADKICKQEPWAGTIAKTKSIMSPRQCLAKYSDAITTLRGNIGRNEDEMFVPQQLFFLGIPAIAMAVENFKASALIEDFELMMDLIDESHIPVGGVHIDTFARKAEVDSDYAREKIAELEVQGYICGSKTLLTTKTLAAKLNPKSSKPSQAAKFENGKGR